MIIVIIYLHRWLVYSAMFDAKPCERSQEQGETTLDPATRQAVATRSSQQDLLWILGRFHDEAAIFIGMMFFLGNSWWFTSKFRGTRFLRNHGSQLVNNPGESLPDSWIERIIAGLSSQMPQSRSIERSSRNEPATRDLWADSNVYHYGSLGFWPSNIGYRIINEFQGDVMKLTKMMDIYATMSGSNKKAWIQLAQKWPSWSLIKGPMFQGLAGNRQEFDDFPMFRLKNL